MLQTLPLSEGQSPGRVVDAEPGPDEKPSGIGHSLAKLSEGFAFINYGSLRTRGGLHVDPADDFLNLENACEAERPFTIHFGNPLFVGIGATESLGQVVDWDHTLTCCPLAVWPRLKAHLDGVAFVNRDKQRAGWASRQSFLIPDPLYLASHAATVITAVPKIVVHCYGFTGSECFRFRTAAGGIGPLVLERHQPDADTRSKARALLAPEIRVR